MNDLEFSFDTLDDSVNRSEGDDSVNRSEGIYVDDLTIYGGC